MPKPKLMPKPKVIAVLIFLCVYVSACATKLEYQSPKQVNLSGGWVLNKESSQEVILPRPKRSAKRSESTKGGGRSRGGKPPRSDSSTIAVNEPRTRSSKPDSMTSIEMTIDQGDDSMGIRYHNDNYRDIDWGEIKYRGVTTTAGWQEETLQIITKSDRMNISESYHLDKAREMLTVTFKVAGEEFYRIYNRKSPQQVNRLSVD